MIDRTNGDNTHCLHLSTPLPASDMLTLLSLSHSSLTTNISHTLPRILLATSRRLAHTFGVNFLRHLPDSHILFARSFRDIADSHILFTRSFHDISLTRIYFSCGFFHDISQTRIHFSRGVLATCGKLTEAAQAAVSSTRLLSSCTLPPNRIPMVETFCNGERRARVNREINIIGFSVSRTAKLNRGQQRHKHHRL